MPHFLSSLAHDLRSGHIRWDKKGGINVGLFHVPSHLKTFLLECNESK
jgi:hypothetical protein